MDEILQQSILTNFFEAYEATTPVADQIEPVCSQRARAKTTAGLVRFLGFARCSVSVYLKS